MGFYSFCCHAYRAICIGLRIQSLSLRVSKGRVQVGHASNGVGPRICGGLLAVGLVMSPVVS